MSGGRTDIAVEPDRTAAEGPTRFAAYAVGSRTGPHVTMQAGVVHADRFWTTTSGSSLKARSVKRRGVAGIVVADGSSARVLAGRTNRLRPFRPLDAVADLCAPLRSTSAVLRLGLGQVEQLIGYFEAGGGVPNDWLPHRRVLLVTRIDRSLALDGLDLVEASGAWEHDPGRTLEPDPAGVTDLPMHHLPESHAGVVRLDRPAHLGISTADGPVPLPARWLGDNRFEVSAPALRAVGAALPDRAVVTFDDSESRRPDEKLGVMFRGSASLADVDGPRAEVLVHPERITTWNGFDAGTVSVA